MASFKKMIHRDESDRDPSLDKIVLIITVAISIILGYIEFQTNQESQQINTELEKIRLSDENQQPN